MGYDLKNMTGKQVLILAKSISGMDCEDIAEKSNLPYSTIRQYFKDNPNSEYFPSFYRIPKLCRALGNNLLFEWQKAQLEELNPDNTSRLKSGTDLLSRVNNLGQELGDVHHCSMRPSVQIRASRLSIGGVFRVVRNPAFLVLTYRFDLES